MLFSKRNDKYYCRACIKYNGKKANISKFIKPKNVKANISYSLSIEQDKVSLNAALEKSEIYIDAVCGAGKTEIVFKSIEKALSEGKRVGFAIPRREVTKEIYDRLKEVYPSLHISLVYGGHNEYLDGDIIVLTTHQAYRYKNKFGLLIIDEFDAFPLKGDDVLLNITKKSSYEKIIYMSATFSKEELLGKNKASLIRRYHNYDIPVPTLIINSRFVNFFILLKLIRKYKKSPLFIYAPTIKEAKIIYLILKVLLFNPKLFTSKINNKKDIFDGIKSFKYKLIVATTILERGITVKGLNVIVFDADHNLFDVPTLIQIVGRVGRKRGYEIGKVYFLSKHETSSINDCINNIVGKNNNVI